VLIFGADAQVDQEDALPWLRPEKVLVRELLEGDVPVLGICFGSQLLAEATGGVVRRGARHEIGWHGVELTPEGRTDSLLGFLPETFESLQYHYYEWLLPPGAVALARSAVCLQAFRLPDRPAWGLQFHPEVTEADFNEWLDDFEGDPEPLRRETAGKIAAWNEIGREIATRFLGAATAA